MSGNTEKSGPARRRTFGLEKLPGTLTLYIAIACVAVYALQILLNLFGLWAYADSSRVLGLSRAGLMRGMLWQPLTSPFVHFSPMHVLFNVMVLIGFGVSVERKLGRARYVVFTVFCALAASAVFLLLGTPGAVCGGYSGVMYGILAASAVLWPESQIYLFMVLPVKMKWAMPVLALLALIFTFHPGVDNVAHAAHLGGALAGYVAIRLWTRKSVRSRDGKHDQENSKRTFTKRKRRGSGGAPPGIRVPDEL